MRGEIKKGKSKTHTHTNSRDNKRIHTNTYNYIHYYKFNQVTPYCEVITGNRSV